MSASKILDDIVSSAIGAKRHYEVWWAQFSEARPELDGVIDEHWAFFETSQDAHYSAFFLNLGHLFDGRSDSSSIRSYLSKLRAEADEVTIRDLENGFSALAERAKPVLAIRHKAIAHIDARLTEKEVFLPLDMTWNEIRDVIYASCDFVERLASAAGRPISVPPSRRQIEATLRMIRSIRKANA